MNNPILNITQLLKENNCLEEVKVYKRGDLIFTEGVVNTSLYYMEEGAVRVFLRDEEQEHTIRFGYQNDIIGPLDSFITEIPSKFNMQVLRKSSISRIRKGKMMEVLNSSVENLLLWQEVNAMLVYSQIEREIDLLTISPRARYERVLNRSPHLFQEVPLKYIASYLRMTPETLSRLRKS